MPRPSADSRSAPWHDGPIVLAGNWEPLIFRRRMNGSAVDLAERYRREHTAAAVRRLREAGVNLLITHYFKGFGLKAEGEDMRQAETLIRLCHAQGLRVGGYIGDTFMYETMLIEEPRAIGWAQIKPNGRPVSFGGTDSFRWKWCRVNPAYRTYMKRVLRRGLAAGLDLLHFDNWLNKPEPKRCHCEHCTRAFREFLLRKYTAAERRERLGFADCSQVRPPQFSEDLYIAWNQDVMQNPLLQEWIDFQCQTVADVFRELGDYCRRLRPDIALETNPTGIWGENSAYMRSVDHARLLPHGHFFWDESPNAYGLLPNGALATGVRSMKMGQALGSRCFFYTGHGSAHHAQTRAGEALAFNGGCLGLVSFLDADRAPVNPALPPYIRLLRDQAALFIGTRSVARVGVYRNFASLAYDSCAPQLQALLAEQALLQHHIPFDLVFDLAQAGERLLVVPGMDCLSAAEIAALKAQARRGAGVLLVGNAARCDAWRRARAACPFGCDRQPGGRVRVGRGTILRLAPLLPSPAAPALAERAVWDTSYKVIDSRFWGVPAHADAFLDALRSLAAGRNPAPFATSAPPTTLVEPRLCADGRLVVHLIRYGPAARSAVRITLRDTRWRGPVTRHIPGHAPATVRCRERAGQLEFALPGDVPYAAAVVEP